MRHGYAAGECVLDALGQIVLEALGATAQNGQDSPSDQKTKSCGAGVATKADSTLRSSRAVPHPSTNRALRRLTSEVGRDPVHSTRYGRQR